MVDRRNLWARLYDEAQDIDPMVALAAIKQINGIAGRWDNRAAKSAIAAGRERAEPSSDTLRQIAEVLGKRGWEIKADRLDEHKRG
jgi:hypothetical protein